jgi:hypothetical protein
VHVSEKFVMPDNHLASKFNADLGLTLIRLLETAGQSEKADRAAPVGRAEREWRDGHDVWRVRCEHDGSLWQQVGKADAEKRGDGLAGFR